MINSGYFLFWVLLFDTLKYVTEIPKKGLGWGEIGNKSYSFKTGQATWKICIELFCKNSRFYINKSSMNGIFWKSFLPADMFLVNAKAF